MEQIKVIMDHRENNPVLKKALSDHPEVSVEKATLPIGDFLINDSLLVERKTLTDLANSIKDGRLFRQAKKLASSKKPTIIILEGTSKTLASIKVKREAIQGALISLALKFNIPLLRAFSPQETAKLMMIAYQQLKKPPKSSHKRINPALRNRLNSKAHQQLHILHGLPGIGPVKAKLLLEKFGTLNAVFSTDFASLCELEGFGKHTAQNLISLINEPLTAYGL